MRILCDVNRTECLRYGIDAPSSTVDIEVSPELLTHNQRNFIVVNLYEGMRFPKDQDSVSALRCMRDSSLPSTTVCNARKNREPAEFAAGASTSNREELKNSAIFGEEKSGQQ